MSTAVFRRDWHRLDDEQRPVERHRLAGQRTKPLRQQGQIYVPPGWPEGVLPPGADDWQKSAVAFLLDCCPSDYRAYPLLRKQPIVLARLAAQFVESQVRASREGASTARAELDDYVDAPVLDGTVEVLQAEEARLVRQRRAVLLVEESLKGKVFIRKI